MKKQTEEKIPKWSNKDQNQVFTVAEMFSGPGGIGLALNETKLNNKGKKFSFEHLWSTDYDKDTAETYKNNIFKKSNAIFYCEDIQKIKIEDLPNVDGFLFGFPCNDFSSLGETKGENGKFGGLYIYGINYINQNNPLFIVAENVSGIKSSNEGKTFKKILSKLNNSGKYGYNLSVHLYKFEEYAVPQKRHRYIIVGIRGDLNLNFEVPKPNNVMITCREAIEIPPITTEINHEFPKHSEKIISRLKQTKAGENAWTATLSDHLKLNVKGAKMSQIYKRLDPNKPAYTITGSGGGGTYVYHWKQPRALTNREKARLQTFPDTYKFYGNKESVRSQIGMAVPVKGAKIILKSLLKTFAIKKYESIKPSYGYFKAKELKSNNLDE
jgi:DNA (cytosine-5)-methyltransferase 1